MNKAKFMLLGIGVVGVVGGALAFKAQKFGGAFYCTDLQHSNCNQVLESLYATTILSEGTHLRCADSQVACTATITVKQVD